MTSEPVAAPVARADAESEGARRADLARMKRRATALLVAVAAVWLALLVSGDRAGWLGYAIAAAEAGMIGGLADWFAVTAVFRHPLGIPIPHTAVVATRKEAFGVTLGDFVQQNFLSPDVVGRRVADAEIARRAGEWLVQEDNARTVARHLAEVLSRVAEQARDEDVTGLLEAEVRRRLEEVDVAPALGRTLRVLTVEGRHEALLDEVLQVLDRFLVDSEPLLRERFTAEAPWWLPEPLDEAIFQRLLTGVRTILAEAGTPREGPGLRQEIHASIESFVRRLEFDPVMAERVEEIKRDLLDNPQLGAWVQSVWGELRTRLQVQAATPGSVLRARLAALVVSSGRRLLTDADLAARVDAAVDRTVRAGVAQFRDDIAGLVSDTIGRWDSGETSDRLELLLGRDLQFIRINGTVVGALAGLAIHGIAQLVG